MSETNLENQISDLSFATKSSVLNVKINFVKNLNDIQLTKNDSLLLIGKSKDLKLVPETELNPLLNKLQIPTNWYSESIKYLCPAKKKDDDGTKLANGTSISWLNRLSINAISAKCSRYNTPSRAHLITKVVKSNCFSDNQAILIACERKYSIACASSVARAFPLYSSKTSNNESSNQRNVTISFIFTDGTGKNQSPSDDEIACYNAIGESVRLTAKIVDTPCAEMTTDHFLEEIKTVAKELKLEPTVIEGEELERRGFGGLWNVGKAAINSPKLVVLSNLKPDSKRNIAWVGKGIVYDTGGLCIKSRSNMCGMKQDCGGAAGVLGAFYAAVKLGFEDNLHAVFCLAENAVGPNAYRPDDIIKLYSGKTVEITNTDAEGRVVLGDGVAYARKDLKADIILDMATLTGAQGISTGKYHAAVLTNSDRWEKTCVETSKICADLCFPMVFTPELHFSEFNSEVADMKNSVSNPGNASSACAGLFIHSHIGSKYEGIWIHLDIASPVTDGDRATGFGVGLLNCLFGDSSSNSALKQIGPGSALPLKNDELDSDD